MSLKLALCGYFPTLLTGREKPKFLNKSVPGLKCVKSAADIFSLSHCVYCELEKNQSMRVASCDTPISGSIRVLLMPMCLSDACPITRHRGFLQPQRQTALEWQHLLGIVRSPALNVIYASGDIHSPYPVAMSCPN